MNMKIVSAGTTYPIDQKNIILLEDNDFFTSSFGVDTLATNHGIGSYLDRITLSSRKYNFSLHIVDYTLMKQIQDSFAVDRGNRSPTKIYINSAYLECFITNWENVKPGSYKKIILEIEAFALFPQWVKEVKYEFLKFDNIETSGDEEGLNFPFSFPFSLKKNRENRTLINNNPNDVRARMIFYGPFNNVDIYIGSNRYNIETQLLENERLVIDQKEKTVTKITVSGDRINMINYRNKEFSIFTQIKPGEQFVNYNGEYSFEIILFDERSEPFWN